MSNPKIVAIIPARMGASRFPGKPLTKILNLPMVEHVRRRIILAPIIDEVYVATCDQEIKEAVETHGGKAVMTANTHERCTDRIAEAAESLQLQDAIIVIVQGDEPLFMPEAIDLVVGPLLKDEQIQCSNLLSRIITPEDFSDIDIVKAVLDYRGRVMFYSRSPIPYARTTHHQTPLRQTGISAFRSRFLKTFTELSPTPLERTESIDFLRMLEHGLSISGVIYDQVAVGVDRPDDVEKIEYILQNDPKQNRLFEQIIKT
ncbi:MAG: 3-deoxy-manno-octulosonate cytidylyltransferase [Candidatus Omnitrophica bacterium CG11_big_fil_rev_8_21_14_0_20_45_26]|uniref:3-deoxy-manno-octulosonate cytidylyltransferase n=1 Tax=Candidatus Abzuiibacterium crystallinum TaxID=1974748 RepID=A0A2H0LLF2_9BACT|nr:MAG: 3-deoxy-manno-octulosonate cytidylyltransferase [Candidatus Omnitrophica bacterium CG11_big_fil_rev_8_21_14_0_20_45_26]PIW64502.1 MAG: 3-deoxy-manno-octulosonate cytidylyltransferase [Candidatus Omnitrophica bacterium CG12_big_fil_rev_8_21_14_0_65_45_16]